MPSENMMFDLYILNHFFHACRRGETTSAEEKISNPSRESDALRDRTSIRFLSYRYVVQCSSKRFHDPFQDRSPVVGTNYLELDYLVSAMGVRC